MEKNNKNGNKIDKKLAKYEQKWMKNVQVQKKIEQN